MNYCESKFLPKDNNINNSIQQKKQEQHNDDSVDNVSIDGINLFADGIPSNPSIIS